MKLFGVKLGSGFWVGAGAVVLAPVIIPVASTLLRSLTKATIKGGLIAYNTAKIATAEAMESFEDMAAEAKSEIAEEPKAESGKKTTEPKTASEKK
jgi:hypothetical protein